jgi:hypothetical protein
LRVLVVMAGWLRCRGRCGVGEDGVDDAGVVSVMVRAMVACLVSGR